MSTTTPFLGLVLYDSSTDQVVTFATFRAVWGGTATSSNFYKIDTAIAALDGRIDTLEGLKPPVRVPAGFVSSNFYQATSIADITAYTTGMTILLSVDTTSNGTVTLDINSLGTKSVMKIDSTGTAINLTGSDLVKNRQYLFMYDGTRWVWVSANSADQIQIVGTSGNVVTVGSTNNLLGTTTPSALIDTTIHAASSKTTPVDADEVGLIDSAASNVLKRLTWANLKATLKTYFDSIYLSTGWRTLSATLTYSSADAPSFVISSNSDLTNVLSLGMKIMFTNNSTTFYGIVTAIGTWSGSAQLITVYGGTDYTVANSAIASPYYSVSKSPFGFPTNPEKWTVTMTSSSSTIQSSPTANTWYNVGSLTISIPIGCWNVMYECVGEIVTTLGAATNAGFKTTLSASNSSESDSDFTARKTSALPAMTGAVDRFTVHKEKIVLLTSKTSYYLLAFTGTSGNTSVGIRGDDAPTIVRCICVYL
jgi:hypothetical protein